MELNVVTVGTSDDQLRVTEFVRHHFLPDMPLMRAFGLDDLSLPRDTVRQKSLQQQDDFCVMATDVHGAVVGVAINRQIPIGHYVEAETPPHVKKEKAYILQRHMNHFRDEIHMKKSRMMEMMEFLDWVEQDARLDTLPENTIELRVLAVHRQWRGRGVARTLVEESVREARQRGYQAVRICCTSEYAARLARAMNWTQHYRLRYDEYSDRAGTDVKMTPQHPHMYIYYYVLDLTPVEDDWQFVFVEDHYA